MPLHRLSLALLLAAAAPAPAAAQRISYDSTAASWTLISGPVCYRLVRRGQYLGFDHSGPASAMPAAPDTAALPRYDLTGLAEDQSLAPTSLRLRSDSVVQLAPDVEELRLRFVHATLPLELEVRYTAWGGDRSLLPRGPPHESGPASGARGFAAQHHVGASRRRLHAAVSLGRLGTRAAVGYGNAGRGRPAIRATRGRSTNGYVPWLSLRNRTLGIEYIAELAWSGNG